MRGPALNWRSIILRNLLAVVLLLPAWAPVSMAAEGIKIELNKLEPADSACRAYLLFQNNTAADIESLKLDLVMFNSDGIIDKRLAVEGGPLPAGKTSVKLFDIQGITCKSVHRVLLNGVLSCTSNQGEMKDCLKMIQTSSLSSADFFK